MSRSKAAAVSISMDTEKTTGAKKHTKKAERAGKKKAATAGKSEMKQEEIANDMNDDNNDDDDSVDNGTISASSLQAAAADEMAAESTNSSSSSSSSSVHDTINSFSSSDVSSKETGGVSFLRVSVPPHRYTPLRSKWLDIYQPIVEHLKLQIRFNTKRRAVELRTASNSIGNGITKAADFIRAFILGFEIRDAIALLRLDDLYIDTFEIKDVKTLGGEHLSRAIGRIAGIGGKTKFTIENSTKTRIVLADTHIHILGSYENISQAKTAVVRLILGSPPGKVYTAMRAVANRAKERF